MPVGSCVTRKPLYHLGVTRTLCMLRTRCWLCRCLKWCPALEISCQKTKQLLLLSSLPGGLSFAATVHRLGSLPLTLCGNFGVQFFPNDSAAPQTCTQLLPSILLAKVQQVILVQHTFSPAAVIPFLRLTTTLIFFVLSHAVHKPLGAFAPSCCTSSSYHSPRPR